MQLFHLLLSSRLGLQYAPIGSQEQNLGVEEGATYLFKQFVSNKDRFYHHHFPQPEKIDTTKYLHHLFTHYNQALLQVQNHWPQHTTLVTFGGDHSISYISLNAVLQRYKKENVGILFFDSHADLHLKETSPTGNFHGMWMRTFLDQFTDTALPSVLLDPTQVAYIGNLRVENAEAEYLNSTNILTINSNEIDNGTKRTALDQWLKRFSHVHITFDVDVFSQSIFSATGTPNPQGFSREEVLQMIALIKQHPSFSLDIVEYNPQREKSPKERALIAEIYHKIIG